MSIYLKGEKFLRANMHFGLASARTIIVRFYNPDNTILTSQVVDENTTLLVPENPTKSSGTEVEYKFLGWSLDGVNVINSWVAPLCAQEVNYYPVYKETARKYLIRFRNIDGSVLSSSYYTYGTMPEYTGQSPTYGYATWTGWHTPITAVTKDFDYVATYTDSGVALSFARVSGAEEYQVTGIGNVTSDLVFIPEMYDGLPVTRVAGSAFKDNATITTVVVQGSNLQIINTNAFAGCINLNSVELPDSLTEIYPGAFSGCTSLTQIDLPEGLDFVGANAFSNCTALGEIKIPESCQEIHSYAFAGCTAFVEIKIPNTVTSIGEGAFQNCSGVNTLTIGEGLTEIPAYAFESLSSLTGTITIPNSITSIGEYAFAGCSNVTGLELGSGVESIGELAFFGMTSLDTISADSNDYYEVDDYGNLCGHNDSGITLVKSVGSKHDSEIVVNDSVTVIAAGAFDNHINAETIIVPDAVTEIGRYAFSGCQGLQSITLPSELTVIEDHLFIGCQHLPELAIPESVTRIETNAFADCAMLQTITVPESVTEMGVDVFTGNSELSSITMLPTTPPAIISDNDYNSPIGSDMQGVLTTITVPAGYAEDYKNASGWDSWQDIITE